MSMIRALFLDDSHVRRTLARSNLDVDHLHTVATARECIDALSDPWDVVYLDHDLGGPDEQDNPIAQDASGQTGMDVVAHVEREQPSVGVFVVHSLNPVAAPVMVERLRSAGYPVERRTWIDLMKGWK